MAYLCVLVGGGICFVILSWGIEVFVSRRQDALRFSSDEKVAIERTERLLEQFGEAGLPAMSRRQVVERICWIWKSSRVVALRSGQWSAVFWLASLAAACLTLTFKSVLSPNSHDLRLLLGVRDFIAFWVLPPRR